MYDFFDSLFGTSSPSPLSAKVAPATEGSRSSVGEKVVDLSDGTTSNTPPCRGRQPQRDRSTKPTVTSTNTGQPTNQISSKTALSHSCPPSSNRSGQARRKSHEKVLRASNATNASCHRYSVKDRLNAAADDDHVHHYRDRSCPPALTTTTTLNGSNTRVAQTAISPSLIHSNKKNQPGRRHHAIQPKTKDLVSVMRNRPHRLSSLFGGSQRRQPADVGK